MTEQPSRLDETPECLSELDNIRIRVAMASGRHAMPKEDWDKFVEEDAKKLLAVVEVERGLKTPQAVADQWRRIADKTRPADGVLAAAFDEKADAWEGIA